MPKEGNKGPGNALSLFFKDKVSEIKKAHPDAVSKKDLARLVGVAWQALSVQEQEPYKIKASADTAEYEAQQKVCVYPPYVAPVENILWPPSPTQLNTIFLHFLVLWNSEGEEGPGEGRGRWKKGGKEGQGGEGKEATLRLYEVLF